MRFRAAGGLLDVLRALEPERVAGLPGVEVRGPEIVLRVVRGLLRRRVERVPVTYAAVRRGGEAVITFFTAEARRPVLRAVVREAGGGAVVETRCLGDRALCRGVERLLRAAARQRPGGGGGPGRAPGFSVDGRYAPIVDGLAEATLVELYLRHPMLERRVVELEEVKKLDEFLERLHRAHASRAREIVVRVDGGGWTLILAIDLGARALTPSLIEGRTRIVGPRALEALAQRGGRAVVTVFALES